MSSENKSYKTQIMVALIGVVGVLGTGLLANWDKVFSPTPANVTAPAVSAGNPTAAINTPPAVTPPVNQAGSTASPVVQNARPQPFKGTYIGVSTEGVTQTQIQMRLQRQGNTVRGIYIQDGIQGTTQGTVNGNTLRYRWSLGGYSGRGVCTVQGNRATGTWGYGMSADNGGTTVAYLQ